MRKFLIRGTCFVGIGLALLFVLNSLYVRTNGYKSLNGTYKFSTVPEEIEVMNLGSSHGEFGLCYNEIDGVTGYNFGLRGQSLYLDLKMLEKYSDRLYEGCTVIIPISYFTFLQARDHSNQHILYYNYLDYGSIPNHNPIEYIKFKLLPILTASFNIKYLINDNKSTEPDLIIDKAVDEEQFKITAEKHRWLYHLFAEENNKSPNNRENAEILGEIITHCLARGFKPVLITTPFTKYYNNYFSQEIYFEFYASIDSITEKYGVPYLDYSHDPRFVEKMEWFNDSDHLNPTGRIIFTEILLGDLGMI